MNPIDLLPVPRPLEDTSPMTETDFYFNVVHPMIPDIIKLMLIGIPVDLTKVKDLEAVLDDTITKANRILSDNPRIIKFMQSINLKGYNDKRRVYSYYYKDFNVSKEEHRKYVINYILKKQDKPLLEKCSKKEYLNYEFSLGITDITIKEAMVQLAEEKADIYNRSINIDSTFNAASPLQKKQFFEFWKLPSEKGKYDRDALSVLLNQTDDDMLKEAIQAMIDISYAGIVRNNFVEAFYNYTYEGRIYGNVKLFGSKAFRITSSEPNLLNMPSTGSIYAKPIKKLLVSSDKDHVIYQVDLSALEDVTIANLSRDKNKCAIFLDGIDGHCMNSYYYFRNEIEKELPRLPDETEHDYIRRYKQAVEDGNKVLKKIRQKSKAVTFGLSFGCFPKKIAQTIKCSMKEATEIFNNYHNKLYFSINGLREAIARYADRHKYIPLGLGCTLHTDNISKDIRTVFNAYTQFWDVISLLTMNKLNTLIKENNMQDKIEIISTIYDAIYFNVAKDAKVIHWLNNNVIKLLTTDMFYGIIVHNSAEGEIGYNWTDTVHIPNNANIFMIKHCLEELDGRSTDSSAVS